MSDHCPGPPDARSYSSSSPSMETPPRIIKERRTNGSRRGHFMICTWLYTGSEATLKLLARLPKESRHIQRRARPGSTSRPPDACPTKPGRPDVETDDRGPPRTLDEALHEKIKNSSPPPTTFITHPHNSISSSIKRQDGRAV